jgi:hypothetical protein
VHDLVFTLHGTHYRLFSHEYRENQSCVFLIASVFVKCVFLFRERSPIDGCDGMLITYINVRMSSNK